VPALLFYYKDKGRKDRVVLLCVFWADTSCQVLIPNATLSLKVMPAVGAFFPVSDI
jgi:hypothetical protein